MLQITPTFSHIISAAVCSPYFLLNKSFLLGFCPCLPSLPAHPPARCVSCRRARRSWGRCTLARRQRPSRAASTRWCSAGRSCWRTARSAGCRSPRRRTSSSSSAWCGIRSCGWTRSSVRSPQGRSPGICSCICNLQLVLDKKMFARYLILRLCSSVINLTRWMRYKLIWCD